MWNEELSVEVRQMLGCYEVGYEKEVGYVNPEQFDCGLTLRELAELREFINVQ